MRNPSHPHFIALLAGLLVASLALPAAAGTYYKWETENGGIAFTDDPKQIPARYRDRAEAIGQPKLDDFERYTPMAASEPAPYAARMDERLDHLRDLNARTHSPDAVGAPSAPPSTLTVRSGRDGQDVETGITPDASGGPVIVEKVRSRPAGSPVTRHITIVRQGDRVLSVIAPEIRHSRVRSTVDERELFE